MVDVQRKHGFRAFHFAGVRRTGRETREPIRCSVAPSMVLPALVPASCRKKNPFVMGILGDPPMPPPQEIRPH